MTVELLTANHVPAGTWLYELTEHDFAKPWHPKESRIEQLRGNTRCTGYRSHENIGDYPIINGMWACARGMGPYKGRFPGGYIERFETLMYVFGLVKDFNPETTMMLFPFGGSVIKRSNIHTIDMKEEVNPTFLGSVVSPAFIATIPDNHYDIVHIDPPYDAGNIRYSGRLYNTPPVKPYDFVSKYAGRIGRTNMAEKAKIGGVVAILHQLVYKKIPLCERIGVIPITTGPNMRVRALNLFVRVE